MRYTHLSGSVSDGGHGSSSARPRPAAHTSSQMLKRPHRRVASNAGGDGRPTLSFFRGGGGGGKRNNSSTSLALPPPQPDSMSSPPSESSSIGSSTSFFSPHSRQGSRVTLASLSSPLSDGELLTPPTPAFLGHRAQRRRQASPDSSKPSSLTAGSDASSCRSIETTLTEASLQPRGTPKTESKGTLASIRDAFKGLGRRFTRRAGDEAKASAEVRHKPIFLIDNPPSPGLPRASSNSSAPCLTLSLAASIDADPFRHEPFSVKATPATMRGPGLSYKPTTSEVSLSPPSSDGHGTSSSLTSLVLPKLAASRSDSSVRNGSAGASNVGATSLPKERPSQSSSRKREESVESIDDYGQDATRSSNTVAFTRPPKTTDCRAMYACTVLKLYPQLAGDTSDIASPRSVNTATSLRGRRTSQGMRTMVACNNIVSLLNSRTALSDDDLSPTFVAKFLPDYAAPQDVKARVTQRSSTQTQLETRAVPQLQKQLTGGLKLWMARPSFVERMESFTSEEGVSGIRAVKPSSLSFSSRCRVMANQQPSSLAHRPRLYVATAPPPARREVPRKSGTPKLAATTAPPARMQLSQSAKSSLSAAPPSPNTLQEWAAEHDSDASEDDLPLAVLSYRRAHGSQCSDGRTSRASVAATDVSATTTPRTPIQNAILARQIQRQREARIKELEMNKKLLADARARRARTHGPMVAKDTSSAPSRPMSRLTFGEATPPARPTLGKRIHAPSSSRNPSVGGSPAPPARPSDGKRRLSVPASPPASPSPSSGRLSRAVSEAPDSYPRKAADQKTMFGSPSGGPMLYPSFTVATPPQQQLPVGYGWAPVPLQSSYFPPIYATPGMPSSVSMYGMPSFITPPLPPAWETEQPKPQAQPPTTQHRPYGQRHSRSASALVPPSAARQRSVLPYSTHASPGQPSWANTNPRGRLPSPSAGSASQPARRSPLAQHVYSQ